MARDYKNTPKPKSKPQKSSPGWLWMLGGLFIGLAFALLVYLQDHPIDMGSTYKSAPVIEKSSHGDSVKKKTSPTPEKNSQVQKPRFDFYNLLPEMEVLIPDQEITDEREKSSSGELVVYNLQVGSFRGFEDADRLRAKLALMSFESHIQKITINSQNSEQTWHRVRVGPFKSTREMGKVRTRLQDQSLDSIILKTVLEAKN